MTEAVGIRFKRAGQIYYFSVSDVRPEVGDSVVVETARGLSLGRVVVPLKDITVGEGDEPLKPVLRKAQPEDLAKAGDMKGKESKALAKCRELAAKYQLAMNPLAAECNLDSSFITIYFQSEKRVDFRSLLRDLSSALKIRVELRQVGARDAAKLMNGMGRCGRPLCCATHLSKFETISMRMAREQDLPLNPANISGVCGRLLCCLSYENEQYRAMKQKMPKAGQQIITSAGEAKVISCNPLKETVTAQLASEAVIEVPLADIKTPRQQ